MNSNKYLTYRDLKVETLANAFSTEFRIIKRENILTPLPDFQAHCQLFTMGSIYSHTGIKSDLSERIGAFGGDHVSSINPIHIPPPKNYHEIIKGKSYFLGIWMSHYGHFITETLSRLWQHITAENYDNFVAFPFVFNRGKATIDTYQAYFLHLLNLPSDNIHFLSKASFFDKIIIPEQGWVINNEVNINIKPLYKKITYHHYNKKGKINKIFLSRNDSYNRVSNTAEVEAVFSRMGFTILYPAQIHIQEQLSIYANCNIMASFSGSSLHNCLFTHENTLIIEVADSRSQYRMLPMQASALELSNNEYVFIPYVENKIGELDIESLSTHLHKITKL